MIALTKNNKYLIACSYGPDSMALTFLMQKEGYNFEIAIVNYHLRKQSDEEVNGLINYCKENHIKIHVLEANVSKDKNIENECRKIRYQYFKHLCDEFDFAGVVVAHHQDDNIETYLMQKNRQNLPIYYGIKEKTIIFGVTIYRPLLNYTKKDLLNICESSKIPFMVDESNYDTSFSRNKIRAEIINNLSVNNRKILIDEINQKNEELNKFLNSIKVDKLNDISYLLSFKNETFYYALNLLFEKSDFDIEIGKANCEEIRKILTSNKPNIIKKVKGDICLIKEYEKIRITNNIETHDYQYVISKPGILDTPYFFLDFSTNGEYRNVNKDDYPLTIRNIKNNDKYDINGYQTSGKRMMIDWKVPLTYRSIWPVVLNKNNVIIFVPRYQENFVEDESKTFFVKLK